MKPRQHWLPVILTSVMQRTGDANFTAQPDLLTQYLQLVVGLPTNSAIQVSPSAQASGIPALRPSRHHGVVKLHTVIKPILQAWQTLHRPLQAFSPNEQCQKPDKCPDDGLFNFTVVCGVPPGQQAVVPAVVAHPPQDDSSTTGRSVCLQMAF